MQHICCGRVELWLVGALGEIPTGPTHALLLTLRNDKASAGALNAEMFDHCHQHLSTFHFFSGVIKHKRRTFIGLLKLFNVLAVSSLSLN